MNELTGCLFLPLFIGDICELGACPVWLTYLQCLRAGFRGSTACCFSCPSRVTGESNLLMEKPRLRMASVSKRSWLLLPSWSLSKRGS